MSEYPGSAAAALVPRLRDFAADARESPENKRIEHRQHIRFHGENLPEIRNWEWSPVPNPERLGTNEPVDEHV